ncbi:BrxA/BrxB family bacilliredoxin [Kitasatospora sp. NPDC004240]
MLASEAVVDQAMTNEASTGLTLVVINSVHGLSADTSRPAVRLALNNGSKRPDHLLTVFYDHDVEATGRMHAYFQRQNIQPSEPPTIGLLKDGEPVYCIPRHRFEGRGAQAVADELSAAFDENGQ